MALSKKLKNLLEIALCDKKSAQELTAAIDSAASQSFVNSAVAAGSSGKLLVAEYVYDFAVDGGAVGVKNLFSKPGKFPIPQGGFVLDMIVTVVTPLASSGSATVAFGTVADPGQIQPAQAFDSFGNPFGNPYRIVRGASYFMDGTIFDANYGKFIMTIADAPLTAGKAVISVTYFVPGA